VSTNRKHIVAVTVKRDSDTQEQEAVLLRWDRATEKALKPLVLVKGASLRGIVSADGRTALVCQRGPETEDEEGPAMWHAYSTANGKQVGSFKEQETMSSQVTVLGEKVFSIVPGPTQQEASGAPRPVTLFALDVKTGKLLWGHPIEPRRAPLRGSFRLR
jgi:hypothetical protein